MALAFLVHFMGDLHQPMHAGDHGDLGGNRVQVSYGIIAGRTNLTFDLGRLSRRPRHLAAAGRRRPASSPSSTPADKAAMRPGSVTDWARESWEASREFAYGTSSPIPAAPPPAERPVITEEITQRLIPIVRRQVARGGLRLARLLDEAFRPICEAAGELRGRRQRGRSAKRGASIPAPPSPRGGSGPRRLSFEPATAGRSLPQLIICIRLGATPRDWR